MTLLFGRKARIIVGDLDVTDFRFGFTIEKHLRKEPNTGKISVWNLSKGHRQSLEGRKDGVPVQVEAGYDTPFLIFKGVLDVALSERESADWITNIYTDDGKDAVKARGKQSYRGGVNVKKVLEDTAKDMGVGIGNLLEALGNARSLSEIGSAFAHGFAAKSSKSEALFGFLDDLGFDGSIQDGEIQVIPKGQALTGTATFLRRDTGLVGTPAVDRKGRLEARSLLISGLVPGAAVEVESVTANGLWRIDSATYVGDTFTEDWHVEIEGTPLQ